MDELGLDLSKEVPKPLTDEAVSAADVVIMGCGDACPTYPGKRYLNWELRDPAGQPVDAVREVRDEIDTRVVGSGHSAMTAVIQLAAVARAHPGTRVTCSTTRPRRRRAAAAGLRRVRRPWRWT